MAERNAHGFAFSTIDGAPLPLEGFRGKPVLVVNTASFCGYTPQYADLEKLHQLYADRGLIVLGVPSNDFGAQEPGTATEIKAFCSTNYRVTFPLTAKQHVLGPEAHPLYRWIETELGDRAAPDIENRDEGQAGAAAGGGIGCFSRPRPNARSLRQMGSGDRP